MFKNPFDKFRRRPGADSGVHQLQPTIPTDDALCKVSAPALEVSGLTVCDTHFYSLHFDSANGSIMGMFDIR